MASHFTVTLDTTPPEVTLLSFTWDDATDTLDVDFSVDEAATVEMWVDIDGDTYPLDMTGYGQLPDGISLQGAAIVVRATDDVGNESTTTIGTILFRVRVLSVTVSAGARIRGMVSASNPLRATGIATATVDGDAEAGL